MNKNTIAASIKAKFPHITTSATASFSRHLPDSLEDAKSKVAIKAEAAKGDILVNGRIKNDSIAKYDPIRGVYSIGLKYGNRWLKDIFGEGETHLHGLSAEEKDSVISDLIKGVKAGAYDNEIDEVRIANQYSRKQ